MAYISVKTFSIPLLTPKFESRMNESKTFFINFIFRICTFAFVGVPEQKNDKGISQNRSHCIKRQVPMTCPDGSSFSVKYSRVSHVRNCFLDLILLF